VDCYNRFGTKNAAWDEDARKFLALAAERFEGDMRRETAHRPAPAVKQADGERVHRPYLVYCHGNLLSYLKGWTPAEPFLRRGLDGLDKSQYPRLLLLLRRDPARGHV